MNPFSYGGDILYSVRKCIYAHSQGSKCNFGTSNTENKHSYNIFRMHPLLCLNGILLVCLKKTKYHQLCLSEMFKRN